MGLEEAGEVFTLFKIKRDKENKHAVKTMIKISFHKVHQTPITRPESSAELIFDPGRKSPHHERRLLVMKRQKKKKKKKKNLYYVLAYSKIEVIQKRPNIYFADGEGGSRLCMYDTSMSMIR